jgi:transposase
MTPAEEIAALNAEMAALRADNDALRAQIHELVAQNQGLQARLAKDSHHSSKPPATDPLGRKRPRSQRRRSGKKPGGQLGHPGETLHLVATPDEVVEHRPAVCLACQTPLDETAPVTGYERRQVRDLPPGRLVVREHRALRVRCPACEQVQIAAFAVEAPSRAQYGPRLRALAVSLLEQQLIPSARVRALCAEVVGAPVSLGTLTRWGQPGAETLVPVEEQIKAALQRAPVLHSDETGVRRAGRLAWAPVACPSRLTHDAIRPQRGSAATDAIGILPGYQGVSVHDGWKPYRTYTSCRQAWCTIHHLRALTFVEEDYHQPWAQQLKELLLAMKAAVATARARGAPALPAAERRVFVARYEDLLVSGLAANPPPPRRPHQRGRVKQTPAQHLLERLWLGQDEVLAFLHDPTIPFDNIQAKQDLRMLKVQQKIAGSFRADTGSEAFTRIRGYCASLRKQGVALLAALETVFTGQPLYPALD